MKLAYIRWRDAAHHHEEAAVADITLAELHEVGFLVREDDEFYVLAMEHMDGSEDRCRNWLAIPKVNVQEIRVKALDRAFPRRKRQ